MGKGEALPKNTVRRISLLAKPKISHCEAIYHTAVPYITNALSEKERAFILDKSLCHHSICNLDEACDVCACNKVIAEAVFLSSGC